MITSSGCRFITANQFQVRCTHCIMTNNLLIKIKFKVNHIVTLTGFNIVTRWQGFSSYENKVRIRQMIKNATAT